MATGRLSLGGWVSGGEGCPPGEHQRGASTGNEGDSDQIAIEAASPLLQGAPPSTAENQKLTRRILMGYVIETLGGFGGPFLPGGGSTV